ncbi:Protein Bop [Saguinus oedipus]|uniref:Protein Bop n=1 Tax=Saguinus oedipus TaxID=9490 RepID=A0ABQ9VE05_SAGOE|nr:Protein Bop [Saguinus oedipus]
MPRGRYHQQGPGVPIWAAADYANAHPWQQMDQASSGVASTPLVDPWIERPCCRDPVCVRTIMEQKSTASGAPGSQLAERGPQAGCMPSPRPCGVDFCWVPCLDPGTFDGSPWLLDRFLAQLDDYMSFGFDHYQDNTSCVYKNLGHLTGRAQARAAPYLVGDLPLPDDYKLFWISRKLFKIRTVWLSTTRWFPVPCPWPPASHQCTLSCLQ